MLTSHTWQCSGYDHFRGTIEVISEGRHTESEAEGGEVNESGIQLRPNTEQNKRPVPFSKS